MVLTSSIRALAIILNAVAFERTDSLAKYEAGVNLKLVMHCLFFDDPKNNKGFIHYKPLKMCKAAVRFLVIFE
tara:strand:+ start:134 stop:352 length:219 start_codon:yes stop_codon:yes gene_type:complete